MLIVFVQSQEQYHLALQHYAYHTMDYHSITDVKMLNWPYLMQPLRCTLVFQIG